MKNIALILAGGVGKRVQSNIPKQFIEVNKKPIIIHTLEKFQFNNRINGIVVVCVEGWEEHLKELCMKYQITKLIGIVRNIKNLYYATKTGIEYINSIFPDENLFVIIHEAVRPLITNEMITDSVNTAHKYGCAVAGFNSIDECGYCKSNNNINNVFDNNNLFIITNPHTFLLSDLLLAYNDTNEEIGNQGTAVLMYNLGKKLYISKGIQDCFKITTSIDIERFKRLVDLYLTND